MKWIIQAKEEEKNKHQTFSADGWTGESKIFTNVVKKWARTPSPLPSQEQQEQEQVSWMARVEEREGDKGARSLLSRLEPPTGTKGGPFVPVDASNRDKRPCPPLARLAVGPGTKVTYCPGPNGSRDKWTRKKVCSVVLIIPFCMDTCAHYRLL